MLKIPQKTEYVIDTLIGHGYEAYIVGGCVRDMLMGKQPHDFDVTTSALPQEIERLFPKTVATGIKHGTVTVIVDKTPIEVTTFRREGDYNDCRHPETVEFVTDLEIDLSRRDFTVNAMAYNQKTGLKDFFGGREDLELKILRAVGNPEKRFCEDALRILRLFRFACVLGFQIEKNTLEAAIKCSEKLRNISSERIMSELIRAVMGENLQAISALTECGALRFLGVEKSPDFSAITSLPPKQELRLFAFLQLSGADTLKALKVLKAPNKISDYCRLLESCLDLPLPESKAELKRILCGCPPEIYKDLLIIKSAAFNENTETAQEFLKQVTENGEPYLTKHLKIGGDELVALGFSGKEVGTVLKKLQELVISNPEANTPEGLMEFLEN
ncbi:MAG: CCA tRNA nucleotidyltransferase [Clostridia bacterium]|nr:CCA tRNA nucleotidyltransferase [Clostridia bacterium]